MGAENHFFAAFVTDWGNFIHWFLFSVDQNCEATDISNIVLCISFWDCIDCVLTSNNTEKKPLYDVYT